MPTLRPEPTPAGAPAARPRRLLDQVRDAVRVRHYSYRTEQAYVGWVRRFVLFHGTRHPAEMGATEVTAFLSALATQREVSASTQNQALAALLFLYREVVGAEVGWLDDLVRAKRPQRPPVVLGRTEVEQLLVRLEGVAWLMAMLLYGSGVRLMECHRLRVKDLDFSRCELTVREAKGGRDRVTMLAGRVVEPLRAHLRSVAALHARDLAAGHGRVLLPAALGRKYPAADREWGWQWVFPASRLSIDPRSGERRRHHLHESVLQRAIHGAARAAGLTGPIGPRSESGATQC